MIQKVFLDHPETVNETYGEHLQQASRFGFKMILAGIACLLHGLIPCLFKSTGSNAIRTLHNDMVSHRVRKAANAESDATQNA